MKKLILVRHGKSSWEHQVSDHDRPLMTRGTQDAFLVAEAWKLKEIKLDKVFSSSAHRAYSTCLIFKEILQFPDSQISISEKLYDFSGTTVIEFLKQMSDDFQTVILFGHNHAFTAIANVLGNKTIANLPTSGLVEIDFKSMQWKDIDSGNTVELITPKMLKNK